MSKKEETKFDEYIKEITQGEYFKIHGDMYQKSGYPDIYIASPQFRGFIETKISPNTCSPLQRHIQARLNILGDLALTFSYYSNDDRFHRDCGIVQVTKYVTNELILMVSFPLSKDLLVKVGKVQWIT